MKNKNVLITGATGAIGSEVLKQLCKKLSSSSITVFVRRSKKTAKFLRSYPAVKVVYGDITNAEDLKEACKNQDYVIHLAGVIPPLADEELELTYKVNVEGTRNLIQALENVL